jgi:hypothetical protein
MMMGSPQVNHRGFGPMKRSFPKRKSRAIPTAAPSLATIPLLPLDQEKLVINKP